MFCEKCGQEIQPGNTFCTSCGAPVKEGAAGTPETGAPGITPPGGGPAPVTPSAVRKGSKKKWIIIAASALSAVVLAAVVLVLVFVVFRSPGPEATMDRMFKAMEDDNLAGVMETVDPSVVNDKEHKDDFREYMKDSMPPGETTITGLKYKTTVKGDEATVKLMGGKAKVSEDGETETYDLAEDSDFQEFTLVKKDGKWYLTKENFMDFFAKLDLQEAEEEMEKLDDKYKGMAAQMEEAFADFGADTADMQSLADQLRERIATLNTSFDTLIEDCETLAKSYDLVYESEEAGDGDREYAKLRLDELDLTIELVEQTKQFFDEMQVFFDGLVNNPNVTPELIDQGIGDITAKFEADGAAVNARIEEIETQIEEMKDVIGL